MIPGLYNQVQGKRHFADPQQLFETDTFLSMPYEFWEDVQPIIPRLATAISTGSAIVNTVPQFGAVHAFLNVLQSKEKLLTTFTQNIDGLELAAGIEEQKTINCHGSWDTATCVTCKGTVSANQYLPVVHEGLLPLCLCAKPAEPSTKSTNGPVARRGNRPRKEKADAESNVRYVGTKRPQARTPSLHPSPKKASKKRKRYHSDGESGTNDPIGRPGLLKPDITFFSEGVSRSYRPRLAQVRDSLDLLLIIGTSLPVEPVNLLPFDIPADVPQIWISNERCMRDGLAVDIQLIGDCDLVVDELCRLAGWTNSLLNRLWKNNLGSNVQAKEAVQAVQARIAAAAGANGPLEQMVQLPLRQAQSTESKVVMVKKEQKEQKEKPAVESKVKVEQVLGFPNRWMVKKLEG